MNIDPKSETQKPDFKPESIRYCFNNLDANGIDIFIAGANHGYSLLQSENQRLTEENNAMLESVGSINAVMDELEELRTYKNANNWISSKDQLPDIIDGKHGGFVWAWDSNYEQGHEEFYDTVRQNPSRWTHWMHLPEPPKPLNHEQS